MTLYFMGTEAEDFPNRGGSITHQTNSSLHRIGVRAAVAMTGTEDATYVDSDAFSSSEFWTHCAYAASTSTSGTQNQFKWYSGGTQKLAFRWSPAGSGVFEVRKWNGSSWDLLATVTDVTLYGQTNAVTYIFDFYIKLGNPGEFRVYFNNQPAISRNDLDLSGIGTIDKVRFSPQHTLTVTTSFSEVIIATWNTIYSKMVLRPPTGNGSYAEWANGGFGVVDDQDATGADLATSGTVGQRVTYTHAAFTALATDEVLAGVKVSAAMNRDAAGPQNMNFMTRISSTDYNGADTALNVTQSRVGKIWETSPATGIAWTVTELNAAAMGVRSRT